MPGETRTLRAWPLALGALLALAGLVPATVGADSAAKLEARAKGLSQLNGDLAAKSRGALLDLYALDSQLARERARLVALRIRTAEVRAARAAAEHRLAVARQSFAATQLKLARRLQDLYEHGDTDPLAVVLGASSVDDALNSLDSMDRIAQQDRAVIKQTRSARLRLTRATHELRSRESDLQALAAEASRSTLALERARADRTSYLAHLANQRRLNAAAISSLQQQAQEVEARARQLRALAAAQSAASSGSVAASSGQTITVVATGYSMGGHTATGAPVGWGVVAVDPSVIPLGTRLSIPGYGEGVAVDTGGSVEGAAIDLWFPTAREAAAWGRRAVTITLH